MLIGGGLAACGDSSAPESLRGRTNRTTDNGGGGGGGDLDPGGGDAAAGTTADAAAPDGGATTALTCTTCHGDANRVAVEGADANVKVAPPRGTSGETASTTIAVGAHMTHLNTSTISTNPIACAECHVVPTSTQHSNGVVDLTFGTRATTGGATPTWNGTSCAGTYCHGSFVGGAAATTTWTGAAMTCTSCHAGPPNTGDHRRADHNGIPCGTCHGTGYSATTVNRALHINGVKNAGGPGSNIQYNAATRACTPMCHGTEIW
ncbi:MAG: hypothetical protein KF764_21780 [Labilithrix sp.]|nr:hypothetical protein [Labilithrix sp.]MBX3225021.1 hypothetical protein [Labilithrix sp.]